MRRTEEPGKGLAETGVRFVAVLEDGIVDRGPALDVFEGRGEAPGPLEGIEAEAEAGHEASSDGRRVETPFPEFGLADAT